MLDKPAGSIQRKPAPQQSLMTSPSAHKGAYTVILMLSDISLCIIIFRSLYPDLEKIWHIVGQEDDTLIDPRLLL
jgi:hypothetical protein